MVYLLVEYKMRILKNRDFHKWAKKAKIKDEHLVNAVREMEKGLFDAKLGAYIYKKRISFGNKGKRGGSRTILAFKLGQIAFFIFGYQKNEIDNISNNELDALRDLAKIYLNFDKNEIEIAIKAKEFIEVFYEKINP